ncbi:ribose import ATP-binding protein RbsA [Actinomadura rubrobrunea]|uniref:Ribose import ATP-binding protein RbsA n=1 Tax=Actinomadura rubrobrunea TaxID=115335 RepID=A0A9W6UUQ1_9ACTN|nr:sugar ABC transporter ATP-binding protein [Actinomadura rubrobrunea]GLW61910.1 ribose import ATP-binding protein RbsA [Actinomadura rubrobrunea]
MPVRTPEPLRTDEPLVRMRGVTKRFGGFTAVDHADLDVHAGEVHVVAGENGAGKSTLMKTLAGVHALDSGRILLDGAAVSIPDTATARRHGIAMVHQELTLAPTLSVAENIVLGREHRTRTGLFARARARDEAARVLATLGARFSVDAEVGELSTGEQQLVEIGRAVAEGARVLIFDEPTAALSAREAAALLDLVESLRASGIAVLYITHRMEEIQRLADRVTVMRDGRVVASLRREEATPEAIVTRMVGRPIGALYRRARPRPRDQVRLRVTGLTDGGYVRPASFEVRAGEVLGIAGIVGAGRSELVRLIFGADAAASGSVAVDGRRVAVRRPADAIAHGIALVPESRKDQGLFLDLSIAENIALAGLTRRPPRMLRPGRLRAAAGPLVARLGIRCRSVDQPVGRLSGGNQQKTVLAKWLSLDPKVLILDEPTRGVDIGAKADIYALIDDIAAQGVAIVLVSSELPEVLGLSDRVLVMREGHIVAELSGDLLKEDIVMQYATGADTAPGRPAA